jgi:E3 ubiquitin-protein ligase RFWD3
VYCITDTDETVQPNKLDISNSNVKEESECLICTEPFVSSGDHRISCLKCGHVFGKNCIEKWLSMPNNKFCPLCNCKATKRDIRTLFIKTLQVMDNSELTEAKKQLEDALKQCSKISLE